MMVLDFHKTERMLKCVSSGHLFEDDGLITEETGYASLLRAEYQNKRPVPRGDLPGLYRYADCLPIDRLLRGSAAPVSYFSEKLAGRLGLRRLLITFNGYWEERGALMRTASFKECEAYSVCARFPKDAGRLVVASAGNTARAFIRAAGGNGIPLAAVVPQSSLTELWQTDPVQDNVKIITVGGDSDYSDAIALAALLSGCGGFHNEGGAKNVARRDGMGTTVHSAAETTGEIPDYYFQAVGSGTGAVAAYEANLRLNDSGLYERKKMKLVLSQNIPFTPMADAWEKRSRTPAVVDTAEAKRQIEEIDAKVLSNRTPPYAIGGGLFDVLSETEGEMLRITNAELREGQALFRELEGCDICPEAGVTVASLARAARMGIVPKDALVMLNITGGGRENIRKRFKPRPVTADVTVQQELLSSSPQKALEDVLKVIAPLNSR